MGKRSVSWEEIFFASFAIIFLLGSIAMFLLRQHLHAPDRELQYALDRLPGALLLSGLWILCLQLLHRWLLLSGVWRAPRLLPCLLVLLAVYCIYWIPAMLAWGFSQDDWYVLAAASIRKVIFVHPAWSFSTLEVIDGNFRPLGTVLYFGFMIKFFGASAFAFLAGSFLINLSVTVLLFFLVQEFGYSLQNATIAALLYLSRGMGFTLNTWSCAVGDGMVIFLCGLAALLILRANKRMGTPPLLLHLAAWLLFVFALLAKQSAFGFPPIAAALTLFAPETSDASNSRKRIGRALFVFLFYGATTMAVYLYSKTLLHGATPSKVGFSLKGLIHLFSYPTWYFAPLHFASRRAIMILMPEIFGVLILLALAVVLLRLPQVLGSRARHIAFFAYAGFCSVALFAFVGDRSVAYYGAMMAFWVSIGLALCLTNLGPLEIGNARARAGYFFLFLLLASGYADIQLKLTGIVPTGGYAIPLGVAQERYGYRQLSNLLAGAPQADSLVLLNAPYLRDPGDFAVMALLADERISEIFIYHDASRTFTSNNLHGDRPRNDFQALADPHEYVWTTPVSDSEVQAHLSCERTLWISFEGDDPRAAPCPLAGPR